MEQIVETLCRGSAFVSAGTVENYLSDLDTTGWGLLHWILYLDRSTLLEELFVRGSVGVAQLSIATNPRLLTPLHVAFQAGSVNVVRVVLKKVSGASLSTLLLQRNQWNETPLHILAGLCAAPSIFEAMAEALGGADSAACREVEGATDQWGRTAHTVARECSNSALLAMLSPEHEQPVQRGGTGGQGQGQGQEAESMASRLAGAVTSEFMDRVRLKAETTTSDGFGPVEEKGIFARTASAGTEARRPIKQAGPGPPFGSQFEYPVDKAKLAALLPSAVGLIPASADAGRTTPTSPCEPAILQADAFGLTLLHKCVAWGDDEAAGAILDAVCAFDAAIAGAPTTATTTETAVATAVAAATATAGRSGALLLPRLLESRDGENRTPRSLAQETGPHLFSPALLARLEGLHPAVPTTPNPLTTTIASQLAAQGYLYQAWRLLGNPYSISGVIIHGEKRGRTIGYPTANLGQLAPADVPIPPVGVYAGWLVVSGAVGAEVGAGAGSVVYAAAISVGDSPTFEGARAVCVESHCMLEDPSGLVRVPVGPPDAVAGAGTGAGTEAGAGAEAGAEVPAPSNLWLDLYGREVRVQFGHFLRPMAKFEGSDWLDQLLDHMKRDCDKAWVLCERGRGLSALDGLD